jgi:hypothetical protein
MMKSIAKRAILRLLENHGYFYCHRAELPIGMDFMLDITRLAQAWKLLPVRTFFDVGANQGHVTAAALARFPESSVYSFEAVAKNFCHSQAAHRK